MSQILTDEEITLIVRECARGSSINRDGSTSHRIARAIEAAVINKLNSAEPVRPDWYQNPTSEQWFESPDDAQILEDLDSITVGDVIELDVCWNGTQMFRVTKLADETSDDVEFELIESSKKFYLHPLAPSAVDVDLLAQFIRKIDGNNSMGAGALAEKIIDWLSAARSEE